MTNVESIAQTSRWVRFVARVTELTQTGRMKWEAERFLPANSSPTERRIGAFHASIEGQALRISRAASRYWQDEDRYEWLEHVSLELLSSSGEVMFEVPQVVGVDELYRAASYQAANVDDFLKRVGV